MKTIKQLLVALIASFPVYALGSYFYDINFYETEYFSMGGVLIFMSGVISANIINHYSKTINKMQNNKNYG